MNEKTGMKWMVVCGVVLFATLWTGGARHQAWAQPQGLVINEVVYDDAGADDREFVELYNSGSTALDLAAEQVYLTGYKDSAVPNEYFALALTGTISAGGFYVIAAKNVSFATPDQGGVNDATHGFTSLMNGPADSVALLVRNGTADTPLDVLTYEGAPANAAVTKNGLTVPLELPAAPAASGDTQSLSRFPDGHDTNNNEADFHLGQVTFRAPNVLIPVTPTVTPTATPPPPVAINPDDVVINEVLYQEPGTDAHEFVELFNKTDDAINLAAARLVLIGLNGQATTPAAAEYGRVALSGTIPSGGYYVVAATETIDSVTVDQRGLFSLQNGPGDSVVLVVRSATTDVLIDSLTYDGNPLTAQQTLRGVTPALELPGAAAIDSATLTLSRLPNGADTNNNSVDFGIGEISVGAANVPGPEIPTPTPTRTRTATPTTTPTLVPSTSDDVVINEVLYSEPGADKHEFVELANRTNSAVDLMGRRMYLVGLKSNDATPPTEYFTVGLTGTIPPNGYYTVAATSAEFTTANQGGNGAPGGFSSLQDGNGNGVALIVRDGTADQVIDSMVYGGSPEFTQVTKNGLAVPLELPAADALSSASFTLSRLPDKTDTNHNDPDFEVGVLTFGAANEVGPTATPTSPPPTITPTLVPSNPDEVVINEVEYSEPGADKHEFVELANRTNSAVDLMARRMYLVALKGNDATPPTEYATVPLTGIIPANGYYTVAATSAEFTTANQGGNGAPGGFSSLMDANGNGVALIVRDGTTDQVIDSVTYGASPEFTQVTKNGLVVPLELPAADALSSASYTLSRLPDKTDTNHNDPDFEVGLLTFGTANLPGPTVTPTPPPPTITPTLVPSNPDEVVINEVEYSEPGADKHEFVELANRTGSAIDLMARRMYLIALKGNDATPPTEYATVPLTGIIPANGYYTVAATSAEFTTANQGGNGAPGGFSSLMDADGNGVALVVRDGTSDQVIDSVTYGASPEFTQVTKNGLIVPLELPAASSVSYASYTLARIPDKTDTNHNGPDFGVGLLTFGEANVLAPPTPTATYTPTPRATPTPEFTATPTCALGDVNCDGHINQTDVLILDRQWHKGPLDQ